MSQAGGKQHKFRKAITKRNESHKGI